MQVYELKDPSILGEEHPTYGFTFWDAQVDGEYPVMFNSKQGNIMPGTRIMAEESELKTSKNGKEYLRLRKVKFEDATAKAAPFEPKAAPTFKKADEEQDKRGDGITASMAFKLAYHGFIQTEQIQPQDEVQWAHVKEQGRQIFWGIKEIMNSQPDGGSQSGGGSQSSPKATNEVKSPPATSKYEFTDEDIPQDES